MNKTLDTARPIDLTSSEAETLGELLDIIHEHINDYELTGDEITSLNKAEEILFRLYVFGQKVV